MSRERKTDPEAWQHTSTNRNIIKGFIDDRIKQRCESSLEAAKTVEDLYEIWMTRRRYFGLMNTTRKSTDDPLTYLSELRKRAKFYKISQVIDGVHCDKCRQKVEVDPNDENTT